MRPFYVTTPIYYVSGAPHVGHAYTSVAADALARYHRARGAPTYFLTGTDEHGEKIEAAASKAGTNPLAFADAIVDKFKSAWAVLDIGYDDFIRTTEPRHEAVVVDLWKRIEAAGDIYLGEYEGWYCVECEAFYTEGQMADGQTCPIHGKPLSRVKEPSFFFAMSKFQDRLLEHFEKHPEFVQPESRRNEIVAFIKTGLRDLSVSRTTFKWGIPVPGHPEHVIYVWLDALANYISALGGPGDPRFEKFWPEAAHLLGKDILRFHAVYWPCFLMSAGLPLPKTLFVHGWWTLRGQKISKSLPATRIDPVQLAQDVGADAVRYFLLREVPLGLDGDFTYESLIGRLNSDLANDLGNLVNRTLAMTDKYVGGVIPKHKHSLDAEGVHADLAALAKRVKEETERCFDSFAPSRALEAIWELVRGANRYVDSAGAWTLVKDPAKKADLDHVLHTFLESVLWAALLVQPVMPAKAAEIFMQLGLDPAAWKNRWPNEWNHDLPHGGKIAKGAPLFPRIDEARQAEAPREVDPRRRWTSELSECREPGEAFERRKCYRQWASERGEHARAHSIRRFHQARSAGRRREERRAGGQGRQAPQAPARRGRRAPPGRRRGRRDLFRRGDCRQDGHFSRQPRAAQDPRHPEPRKDPGRGRREGPRAVGARQGRPRRHQDSLSIPLPTFTPQICSQLRLTVSAVTR